MKPKTILFLFFYFFLFLGSQLLIFRNIAFFNLAFCFIYVGFILVLPFEMPHLLAMLIALGFGLIVDTFYDTIGMHAAACVLIAYLRPHIINILTPRGGYDTVLEVSITSLGFQWFTIYSFILIFAHHSLLFLIEAWDLGVFFRMLFKIILSSFFTLTVFILYQYLFFPSKKFKQ